jgi:MerR family redox-sensitive transcriptional activator SoxR
MKPGRSLRSGSSDSSKKAVLTIGELATCAGVSVSAIRFYEDRHLLSGFRTQGQQRRYREEMVRRLAFIRAAQAAGLSLSDIRRLLDALPGQQTPTRQDWEHLSQTWQPLLQARIDRLVALRDNLAAFAGSGCGRRAACPPGQPEDRFARGAVVHADEPVAA